MVDVTARSQSARYGAIDLNIADSFRKVIHGRNQLGFNTVDEDRHFGSMDLPPDLADGLLDVYQFNGTSLIVR